MPAHNDGLQLKARAAGRDQQEQQVREKLNSGHECGLFMEGCLKVVALGQSQAKGPRPGCLTIICETAMFQQLLDGLLGTRDPSDRIRAYNQETAVLLRYGRPPLSR